VALFFSSLPTVVVVILALLVSVGGSVAGLLLVRRFVPLPVLVEHNDVAGFIFAAVAVIYAVILASVVVAVWEAYERDRDRVSQEAARIVNMYRESSSFSDPDRDALRAAIRAYTESVVDSEWPAMKDGENSPKTELSMEHLWKALHDIDPANEGEGNWYQGAIDSLKNVSSLRQERLGSSTETMPTVLIVLLIFGGVITVSYTYLYGVRNIYGQALMTAALASTIGMAIALVLVLDGPFRGDTAISPAPFQEALALMDNGLN
jgi:hypothetical protein